MTIASARNPSTALTPAGGSGAPIPRVTMAQKALGAIVDAGRPLTTAEIAVAIPWTSKQTRDTVAMLRTRGCVKVAGEIAVEGRRHECSYQITPTGRQALARRWSADAWTKPIKPKAERVYTRTEGPGSEPCLLAQVWR